MRLAALCAAVIGGACSPEAPLASSGSTAASAAPELSLGESAVQLRVDTLARGLNVPWAVATLPDGRLLISERGGRIVALDTATRQQQEWARISVYAEDPDWGPESGLLGLALAPDFETSKQVFVMATRWKSDGDRDGTLLRRVQRRVAGLVSSERGLPFENQIIRFTERNGVGADSVVVLRGLPANHYHAGGGLAFGPDGMLYASVGDVLHPELALNAGSKAGKILRYRPDGSVPDDNPEPDSPLWASGLRNTQAFDWLPDGSMLGADHGPTGMTQEAGRAGNDELNLIVRAASYGWPEIVGAETAAPHLPPLLLWREAIAPAGMSVYRGGDARWAGSVFVAGLRGGVERITLERDGAGAWKAIARESLSLPGLRRVRGLRSLEDGSLLVFTSNRDARGQPAPDDDLLLRLVPMEPK
jgi:glucose/arabinose dehydrogenase